MSGAFTDAPPSSKPVLSSEVYIRHSNTTSVFVGGIARGMVRVGTPVAKADEFDGECDNFWLYYTCGTYAKLCTNRLITNTAARTRVLGLQMYNYKAAGFLQWGYNYYYDRMSEGWFDPKVDPDGYKLIPGCSYLCYPESDGAVPALREIHMREAFDDLRALFARLGG